MQGRPKSPSYQPVNPELYAEEKNLLVHTNSPANSSITSCPECKKSFSDARTLQRHSVIHRGLRPFSCQDCGKSFMLRGDLTRHLLIHSGKRPYSCNICERRFTLKGNLMQHIRTHTPEKQFTCTLCRKSFSQRESLYRHIRAHFGEKPFGCETCGKSFSLRGDLTRHLLIHTGQRPHLCPICSRSFALKGNMMQHMRTHTNCVELMALRETEGRPNTILSFAEAQVNGSSVDKHIWQVTETPNSANNERGHAPVGEPQIDVHYHRKDLEGKNSSSNSSHMCIESSPSREPPVDKLGQQPKCDICTKESVPQPPPLSTSTYFSHIRPLPVPMMIHAREGYATNLSWNPDTVHCSLCGKTFKNRRYLKLHVERHKLAQTDFTCTQCHKSFLSKSEHFFHSCKGPSENDGRQKEHCGVVIPPPPQLQMTHGENLDNQNVKQETNNREWRF